ncbi:MAG: hypothetical protein KGV46_02805 [Pasteurella sp.]|nr:hypothetical protein [Pasteurella sp.]
MATPQEVRNIRLKNDYKEMQNIKGNVVTWRALSGNAPYVEEYELTVNLRSIIGQGSGNNPEYRDTHVLRVSLPADYPTSPPQIEMITTPYVFHPNFFTSGRWCYGSWVISEGLGRHVVRMLKTLSYDLDVTNENSPANSSANRWYLEKRNSGLFPCNSTTLPDPTKNRFEPKSVNKPKKKFVIKNR